MTRVGGRGSEYVIYKASVGADSQQEVIIGDVFHVIVQSTFAIVPNTMAKSEPDADTVVGNVPFSSFGLLTCALLKTLWAGDAAQIRLFAQITCTL